MAEEFVSKFEIVVTNWNKSPFSQGTIPERHPHFAIICCDHNNEQGANFWDLTV
jgi:hypothetical protein